MPRTLTARHDSFRLNRPFRIARGTKVAADVVTVTISGDGVIGRGEGVPYPRYGETIDGTLAAIESARVLVEQGGSRADLLGALAPGAARNALDCALWDWELRSGITSAAALPPARRVATAMTVVIDTPTVMAKEAALLAHHPLIKVKLDADDPATRLRAVRAAAPSPGLIVDPNESWDEGVLRAAMPMLTQCRVTVIEQPVPAGDDDWLTSFDSPVPVCADEAIHTVAELDRVAARYDAINVKLDKAGGLTAGLELAQAARDRGMQVMSGCMVCSSLGIAPALHIARLAGWADLDGPLWLADDRAGGVRETAGWMQPPGAGFWG